MEQTKRDYNKPICNSRSTNQMVIFSLTVIKLDSN